MIDLMEKYLAITLSLCCMLLVFGCDSDDSVNENDPVNITGSYELTTTVVSNTCGIPNAESKTEIFYLDEDNNALTLHNFNGQWGQGEIAGDELDFSGSESSDDFGCRSTLSTVGLGTISDTDITGTFTTAVVFDAVDCPGFSNCSITSSFSMIMIDETTCFDRAIFGNPDSSAYILPFTVGTSYPVYQSYCCRTGGHRDQLAYDFTMPIGDDVLAMREGIVREIKEDSPDDGQGVGNHNRIYIQHDDGSAAVYAHLMQNSVLVEPGDIVSAGDRIASSGNSGYSGEPHLHIGVYADYPPVEGVDNPFNFRNADGPLDSRGGLIRGEIYTALPFS